MSSVSYANAAAGAATGSSPLNGSAEVISQDYKVEQTTSTEEVDDSSATTEEDVRDQEDGDIAKDASETSTKTSSKQSKKEKAKANLAPAPVPTVSPWVKKTSPSVTSANVNEKHWPTPEVSVLDEQNGSHSKQKNVIPVVKSTGKEKWVPFQASVVMSGPKSAKGTNQNNNNNGGQKKSTKGKKSVKPQQDTKQNGARRNQRQSTPKGEQNDKKTEDKHDAPVSTKSEVVEDSTKDEKSAAPADSQTTATATAAADNSASHQETEKHQHHHESHHSSESNKSHFDHQHHSRQYSNGGARRHNNRPQHGYAPFNRNMNFIPTTYLPSGQVFQPRGYNQGFIPQQNGHPHQMDGFRRFNGFPPPPPNNFNNQYAIPILPVNPAVQQINQINAQDPVTSLAFQVDYYFSVQNLVKDIFLRKQMDSEGYIPLKAIANFYRVQHLSGGDLKLVVDALDSCGNLEYVGNKETFDLKLRAKENPLTWVLPEDQRD